MSTLFTIGRILLVLIFVLSGVQKLIDISATAALIAPKVVIPAMLANVVTVIETNTGMPIANVLSIVVGLVEILCALLIIFNFATRFAAVLLILFTIAATYYFHDFWNMTGVQQTENTMQAMKNVSIVGGLLVIYVLGAWRSRMDMQAKEAETY